jgi:hypothetical protein
VFSPIALAGMAPSPDVAFTVTESVSVAAAASWRFRSRPALRGSCQDFRKISPRLPSSRLVEALPLISRPG